MKYYCGADPGFSGGVALISEQNDVFVIKTPLDSDGQIDGNKLHEFLESVPSLEIVEIYIEDVHSIYGSASSANFQFGRALGILEGFMMGMKRKFKKVQPKTWQKELFAGVELVQKLVKGKLKTDTKAMALMAVTRLFPDANLLPTKRCKKPSDGIVDAILIAEYGRRKFK